MNRYAKALQKLWNGSCDIYARQTTINPANGRDETEEILLHQTQPCRLSYGTVASTKEADGAALVQQTVKVFLDKNLQVPPGAKLVICQNGETQTYHMSGEPAIYSVHQEIPLELFDRWA